MFPLSTLTWVSVGAILVLSLGLMVQTKRLDSLQKEYGNFVVSTQVQGDATKKLAEASNKANKLNRDKVNAENKNLKSSIAIVLNSLRTQHSASSFVPGISEGSKRPDLLCFDRAEYIRADGEFTTAARRLSDEGTEATIDLNSAKTWALNIN